MNRLIVPTLLACTLGGQMARAEGPPMAGPASRAWAISEVVLARHLDPPPRQQMFLAGIKAMARAAGVATPGDLARRVSDLSTPEQLATLLAEVMAGPKAEAEAGPDSKAPARRSPSDGLPPEDAFFEGLLSVVPGESRLISEKERKVLESFDANLYVGVQIQLGIDEKSKRPVFMDVLEGGPAEAAGAKAGDLIEEVGGESTEGMPLSGVVDRLRGKEGTDVLVRFRRPETGEVFTKTMIRGRLPRATIQGIGPLPGKRWSVRLDGPAPIGYLKIAEISGSTPQELRAFAAQLESEGARALVLDLRGVGGAGFHPTVLLADALLDGGVIGRVKSVDGEKTYRAEPDALFRDWPMVVLAAGNRGPSIAWLCDALRDNHRATILGEPPLHNDPVVHEMVPLPGGEWWVQIATGRLERGDGRPLTSRSPKGLLARAGDMVRMQPGDPEMRELLASFLEGSKKTAADTDEFLSSKIAEVAELARQGKIDLKPGSLDELNRILDQFKKTREYQGWSAMPAPAGPGPNPPAPFRDLAQQRDLNKARELLTEALKTTAK